MEADFAPRRRAGGCIPILEFLHIISSPYKKRPSFKDLKTTPEESCKEFFTEIMEIGKVTLSFVYLQGKM